MLSETIEKENIMIVIKGFLLFWVISLIAAGYIGYAIGAS